MAVCHCCVLSGTGLCVGLITRPEESYQLRCVWVWLWILDIEEALAHWGLSRYGKNNTYIFLFNCTTISRSLPRFALLSSWIFHLFLKTNLFLVIMTASFVILSLGVLNVFLYGLFIKKVAMWFAFVTIILVIGVLEVEIFFKNDCKETNSPDSYINASVL